MFARTLLTVYLACSLICSVPVAVAGDQDNDLEPTVVVSPDDVVENGPAWRDTRVVAVKFEVGTIMKVPTIFPDGSKHSVLHLVPNNVDGDFTTPISRELQATLHRIGIDDIPKHFVGKTVTIKGYVSATGLNLIGSPTHWTYHIALRSAENIVSVKSHAENGKQPDNE